MYIGLSIDSEHYTDLDYVVSDSITAVQRKMEPMNWEETVEGSCRVRGLAGDEEDWTVGEIHEAKDNPYIVVEWHGYNGVDFLVSSYATPQEALAYMKEAKHRLMEEGGDVDVDEPSSFVMDTGDEWKMLLFADVKEVAA